MEWIDHRTPAGQEAGCIICVVGNILVVPLEVNAFQLVIESGLAEAFLAVVKAYELRGASKVQDANPLSGMMPMYGLARLDLAAPEAQPIVELLAGMGSALRFTLEHPLEFLKDLGLTTASCCAVSLALWHTNALRATLKLIVVRCGFATRWCARRCSARTNHREGSSLINKWSITSWNCTGTT